MLEKVPKFSELIVLATVYIADVFADEVAVIVAV